MTWLLIAYTLVLVYLAANPNKIADKEVFRSAWICFAAIPVSNFVSTLFRAGNIRSTHKLALVEVWASGVSWLILGISLLMLINALVPKDNSR